VRRPALSKRTGTASAEKISTPTPPSKSSTEDKAKRKNKSGANSMNSSLFIDFYCATKQQNAHYSVNCLADTGPTLEAMAKNKYNLLKSNTKKNNSLPK
jgi:hypothetical protein